MSVYLSINPTGAGIDLDGESTRTWKSEELSKKELYQWACWTGGVQAGVVTTHQREEKVKGQRGESLCSCVMLQRNLAEKKRAK